MKKGPCVTPGCRNQARPARTKCHTCQAQVNPARYAYRHLKANAKRRGKPFDLTLEQFTEFAQRTEYMTRRGRTASSYHIDRIDPEKGYTASNIQVLTNRENVLKQRVEGDYNPETRQMEFWTVYNAPSTDEDVPF